MKAMWIIGGATAGGVSLGVPGVLLGAGIGYLLAARSERRREQTGPEAGTGARYPEEAIIDAMQQEQAEDAELEDRYRGT